MSASAGGGLPSRLVLLRDLNRYDIGTKIRFLGCINSFDIPAARLTLVAQFPITRRRYPHVHVDIEHVLELVKAGDVAVGTWVNVIGYITALPRQTARNANEPATVRTKSGGVHVQALLLWSADADGADMSRHHEVVRKYRETIKALAKARKSFQPRHLHLQEELR